MVEKKGGGPRGPATPLQSLALSPLAAALRQALNQAELTLAEGEPGEAERRAKAVSALVKAARETVEFENAVKVENTDEDVEALRAELRRRIARYVEADLAGAPDEVLERIAVEGLSR